MKNLFIPPLGTEITLAEDWSFDLWNESRNDSLAEAIGIIWQATDYDSRRIEQHNVTIPAGTTLKIDRIYIRKGQDDFDSVTFLWKGNKIPSKVVSYGHGNVYKVPSKTVRFWAKLDDVNKILVID